MQEDYKLIPLAGQYGAGLSAKVTLDDYEWASKYRWYLTTLGYVFRQERVSRAVGDRRRRFVMLHREVMNFPEGHVHHINEDKLDCRRSNLEAMQPGEHRHRHRVLRGRADIPPGVYQNGKRWIAKPTRNGKSVYLGTHDTPREAAAAIHQYDAQG